MRVSRTPTARGTNILGKETECNQAICRRSRGEPSRSPEAGPSPARRHWPHQGWHRRGETQGLATEENAELVGAAAQSLVLRVEKGSEGLHALFAPGNH